MSVERVQENYNSKAIGLSELEALANFNLAPFTVRRQIAALGALHRRVLGDAPAPIVALFPFASSVNAPYRTRLTSRLHNKQLEDPASGVVTEMFRRSLFGHIAIYNRLPQAKTSTIK